MNKKVYIIISIDTECDKDPKWEIPQPMEFQNILLQSEVFNSLYEKYNIRPTYLLSPEVLKSDICVEVFKNFENIEIGTHLHEEFIEPNANPRANRTKNIQADLSYEEEKQKLTNLSNLFMDKFGYMPTSFRAGRFGYSSQTFQILQDLGYLVDSSITPFKTNYFNSGYKTNGWGKRIEPYFCTKQNRLLQVPVTIINRDFNNFPSFILNKLESRNTSLIKKTLIKLGYTSKSEWLRPFRADVEQMISISNFVIRNNFREDNFVILNIMFHSNEILPGASPYCSTEAEVEEFVLSLDILFEHLSKNHNLCFIGLSDLHDIYAQK